MGELSAEGGLRGHLSVFFNPHVPCTQPPGLGAIAVADRDVGVVFRGIRRTSLHFVRLSPRLLPFGFFLSEEAWYMRRHDLLQVQLSRWGSLVHEVTELDADVVSGFIRSANEDGIILQVQLPQRGRTRRAITAG